MKRWQTGGAFLLTLALLAGPTAGAPGKGHDGNSGKGRAGVARADDGKQRQGRARSAERRANRGQAAQAEDRRGGERRAERSAGRRSAAPEERRKAAEQRQQRHVDRPQRATQAEPRRQGADRRAQAQRAQAAERRADGSERRERAIANRPERPAERQVNTGRERVEQQRAAETRRDQRRVGRTDSRRDAVRQEPARRIAERRLGVQREAAEQRRELRRDQDGRAPILVQRDRSAAPMRFRGLDRNGDGRVSRAEWRGNDVSFRNHDWNGDGVLAGAEVMPGAHRGVTRERPVDREGWVDRDRLTVRERFALRLGRGDRMRPQQVRAEPLRVETVRRIDRLPRLTLLEPLDAAWTFDEKRFERQVRVDGFAPIRFVVQRVDLTPIDRALVVERFTVLDVDRDRYVTWSEWPGPRPLFRDLDRDGDGRLLVSDFDDVRYVQTVGDADRERYVAFHLLDVDDDGLVAPWEWTGDLDLFFLVDVDDDGVITLAEYLGLVQPVRVPLRTAFASDLDGDGRVTPVDWWGDPLRFARLDLDRDGELEPLELIAGWLLRA